MNASFSVDMILICATDEHVNPTGFFADTDWLFSYHIIHLPTSEALTETWVLLILLWPLVVMDDANFGLATLSRLWKYEKQAKSVWVGRAP